MASSNDGIADVELKTDLQNKLESRVVDRSFCLEETAPKPLNVTCYGSSSSKTPERYLEEARLLGYIIAKRGHVCINGAGSFGCMAAMNDGVYAGEGHVRGVIHEMFLADNGYFDVDAKTQQRLMRRGSSHAVFENAVILSREEQRKQKLQQDTTDDGAQITPKPSMDVLPESLTPKPSMDANSVEPIREILVAGGPDLQERKKFLVADTDALIVLPGGPGTWDELWEMACARHLNLNQLPIVCVNVDGYYEPFKEMLHRAYADKLIRLPPHEIVRFASNAEDAVRFVEGQTLDDSKERKSPSGSSESSWPRLALAFVAGAALGMAATRIKPRYY